jgi:FixJ family two-component response regulator
VDANRLAGARRLGRGERAAAARLVVAVAAGVLNKVIADRLGIAETTIKVHRGRVIGKMGAASLADLVRMSERIGLAPGADPARR